LCPKLAQNRPKIQKKLEKRIFEEKSQKMTKKVFNLNKVVFAKEVILGPEIHKNCQKKYEKSRQKLTPQKMTFKDDLEQFLTPKKRKLEDFGSIFDANCSLFPSFF